MTLALVKDLSFIDDGKRIDFSAGTAVEVVDPEKELAGDPHRLGLVLAALAERRRRFRPGVAVRIGGRVRAIPARAISESTGDACGGTVRNRGPPAE